MLPFQGQDEFLLKCPLIRFVAADIVNNCNLRCPFCVVDYSEVTKTELMTEETFRSLLRLLPIVPAGGFWLSCLHEPTLHPKLNRFIDLIPRGERAKFWYTTNLARPIDDGTFEHWAESGLDHINVSFDTLDAEIYAVLRKFGRFDIFIDNVNRMAGVFRKHPEAPKIRYITLGLRSTLREIPEIVKQTRERYHAHENEVRHVFKMSHTGDDFRRDHYLEKEEWPGLGARLKALGYSRVVVCPPADGPDGLVELTATNYEKPAPESARQTPAPGAPFELRARPNGRLLSASRENSFSVNINELEDPVGYFTRMARKGVLDARVG